MEIYKCYKPGLFLTESQGSKQPTKANKFSVSFQLLLSGRGWLELVYDSGAETGKLVVRGS